MMEKAVKGKRDETFLREGKPNRHCMTIDASPSRGRNFFMGTHRSKEKRR